MLGVDPCNLPVDSSLHNTEPPPTNQCSHPHSLVAAGPLSDVGGWERIQGNPGSVHVGDWPSREVAVAPAPPLNPLAKLFQALGEKPEDAHRREADNDEDEDGGAASQKIGEAQ